MPNASVQAADPGLPSSMPSISRRRTLFTMLPLLVGSALVAEEAHSEPRPQRRDEEPSAEFVSAAEAIFSAQRAYELVAYRPGEHLTKTRDNGCGVPSRSRATPS